MLRPQNKQEEKLLAMLRAADEPTREFLTLAIEVMADLQRSTADGALFRKWLKGTSRRPIGELLKTLRTGAWRDEARRMERRRVLKMAAGAK